VSWQRKTRRSQVFNQLSQLPTAVKIESDTRTKKAPSPGKMRTPVETKFFWYSGNNAEEFGKKNCIIILHDGLRIKTGQKVTAATPTSAYEYNPFTSHST